MADKIRLQYGDYRPLQKGDPGYSPTSRRMYSPSSGKSISRREFTAKAERIPLPPPAHVHHGKPLEKIPRKSRIDKGIAKADRATILPMIKQVRARKGTIARQEGLGRFQAAKEQYEKKTGIPYDSAESDFYERYDKIRHPFEYDIGDVVSAYDDFFYDSDIGDYIADYGLGESE